VGCVAVLAGIDIYSELERSLCRPMLRQYAKYIAEPVVIEF
jgi:hypothetical protein